MMTIETKEENVSSQPHKGIKKVATSIQKGINNLFVDNKLDKAYMGILHILLRIPKEIDPKKLETYKWINKSDLKNEDFRRFMRKTNDRVQKSNISKNEQVQEFLAFVKKRAEKVNVLDNREDTLKNKESYDLLKTRMQIIVQSLEKLHGAFDTADVQKYLHAERLNDYFIPSNKDFLDVVNFKILGELVQLRNSTEQFLKFCEKTGSEKYKEYLEEQKLLHGYHEIDQKGSA